jgi:hypothetical protein
LALNLRGANVKEVEVEFPAANIDAEETAKLIAQKFGLALNSHGMTQTRDIFLDTRNYQLLMHNYSFRLRHKLDNIYTGEGTRLTFKYPLEDSPDMLVREELKMKTSVKEFDEVIQFVSGLSFALVKEPVHITLAAEETSREFDLGEKGRMLRLAFDAVKFKDPADQKRLHAVNYMEIEDHGIGAETLLQVKAFIEEYYSLAGSLETKYRYGLRALSLLPV